VNGSFTMNLFCNQAGNGCSVITAGGLNNTQWQLTVQETGVQPPIGTGPQTFSVSVTLSGAGGLSQSLSTTLNAAALALTRIAGSAPGGSVPNLQYKATATTLGGATFNYNAAGGCNLVDISCDNIANTGTVPGSGYSLSTSDPGPSEFNFFSVGTATAANGGGGLAMYTANSTGSVKPFGPNAIAGFFRASVSGASTNAVALESRVATFAGDTTNSQSLAGFAVSVALNKTTAATFVTDATALLLPPPACDFPACSTIERAHNLYGLKIQNQNGFGTVEQAALKIEAQTPGIGSTYSVKCDAGCGIANFGDGVQVRVTAFASLPACAAGTEGLQRAVSDSNTNVWGANIAGGGANHVLGYCDGTNWTVAAK
jgi:hypothetical protein